MTSQDDKPTREEATYAAVLGFLRRNASTIAWLAPLPVVFVLPRDGPWAVPLVLLYLGEAIVYRVVAGPGASLFGRNPRVLLVLGAFGVVALTQLIVWVRDR